MDDSTINPILLSSSAHLENVEQLIKNLEKQTLDLDNFEDILSNRNRQDIITKSFSSVSSNNMTIDDIPEDNFLVKSISLAGHGSGTIVDGHLSMDSLFNQRDLFDNDDLKNQQTPPGNDQSLYADHEAAFTWDDQYDARANYRLTFSTSKQQQQPQQQQHSGSKSDKSHRHKYHHQHRPKQQTTE
jgi:outer membrane receptor for ferrienterochelin and colicin